MLGLEQEEDFDPIQVLLRADFSHSHGHLVLQHAALGLSHLRGHLVLEHLVYLQVSVTTVHTTEELAPYSCSGP